MNFQNQKPLFKWKRCSRCWIMKPATTETFYFEKDTNRLSSWCRDCHKARQKKHDEKRRAIAKWIAPEGFKKCSKCGSIKPATNEFFAKHGDGLRSSCKVCGREYTKEYNNRINFKRNEETIKKIKIEMFVKAVVYSILVAILIYLILFK